MDAKQRIQELTQLLNEANYKYYVLDDPTMPDFEYDRLLRELEDLEARFGHLHCSVSSRAVFLIKVALCQEAESSGCQGNDKSKDSFHLLVFIKFNLHESRLRGSEVDTLS